MRIVVTQKTKQTNNQQQTFNQKEHLQNLNEAQQIIVQQNQLTEDYEDIMYSASNQFKFDCGCFMGNLNVDTGTKFCIKWHLDNTFSEQEFISSIRMYLSSIQENLTDSDVKRLQNVYKKFGKK